MGFGIRGADITSIKAATDHLPADPAGQTDVESAISAAHAITDAVVDEILIDTDEMQPKIPRVQPVMDFWSDQEDKITINDDDPSVGDVAFPDVVVAGLPSGVTISRVIAILKVKAIKDTSAADNKIEFASKTIRVKKSTGAWGTADLVAINFDQNQWYTTASTKENGDVMIGDNDVKNEVDGDATYNFRSEETNRSDAISALADSLELYDVQMGLRVYFTV